MIPEDAIRVESQNGTVFILVTGENSVSVHFDSMTYYRVSYKGSLTLAREPGKGFTHNKRDHSFYVHRIGGSWGYKDEPHGKAYEKMVECVTQAVNAFAILRPKVFRTKHHEDLLSHYRRLAEKLDEARQTVESLTKETQEAFDTWNQYTV